MNKIFGIIIILIGTNAFATNGIEGLLNNNLGERTGTTSVSSQKCGLSIVETSAGYDLTYYPGWSDGNIGQVASYPNLNKWSLDESNRILSVRLFSGPSNNGFANLKYNTSGQIVAGQIDDDADTCSF